MAEEVRLRLKAIRNRSGLRSRDVAESVGMPASTYQKYEDRRRGAYLPLDMVAKLVLTFEPCGISPDEVWALAKASDIAAFHDAWSVKMEAADEVTATATTPVAELSPDMAAEQPAAVGRRRHERWNPLPAQVGLNGTRKPCVVKDISPGGARVLSDLAGFLQPESDVSFELARFGQMKAKVAHLEGNEIGLRFSSDTESRMSDWLSPMQQLTV
jgi:transcriptional regulator with XRE-family HTH domain